MSIDPKFRPKTIVLSVTNDLATDQRVQRTIGELQALGFAVFFIGRQLPDSLPFAPGYPYLRMQLWFHRGFLFYAEYNLRLLAFLLRHRFDGYWSNDLDTLLPNFIVSKLRRKPLIYDSHEFFTGVPEIQNRPLVKAVWTGLERLLFPRLNFVLTVNKRIADRYARLYAKEIAVVRNIGKRPEVPRLKREDLGLPAEAFLLINQGAGINVDRGAEEALEALLYLPEEVMLLLVGKGDALPILHQRAREWGLENRFIHVAPQPYSRLLAYTALADLGLSLDKPKNPNYRDSLPNKLFDYFHSQLPVLVSPIPAVEAIVTEHQAGEVLEQVEPQSIARAVQGMRQRGMGEYRNGALAAARAYRWEQEATVLHRLIERAYGAGRPSGTSRKEEG